jgi:glycosyltransferase involved in cell wall biosynthesis
MRDTDVYITLTKREGLSNATLDALALGLPLILSDGDEWAYCHGGAATVWDAWACQPDAAAYDSTLRQIGDELALLANSPAIYADMSAAAVRTAARFTYGRYRRQWSHVLEAALK